MIHWLMFNANINSQHTKIRSLLFNINNENYMFCKYIYLKLYSHKASDRHDITEILLKVT